MESHAMIMILLLLLITIIVIVIIITIIIIIIIIIIILISYLCEVVLSHLALHLPSAVCNKHTLVLISIMRLVLMMRRILLMK